MLFVHTVWCLLVVLLVLALVTVIVVVALSLPLRVMSIPRARCRAADVVPVVVGGHFEEESSLCTITRRKKRIQISQDSEDEVKGSATTI